MKHLRIDQHILQNVAPSNLNRDDMGAPKDAMFGGFRRARISSQATKRSVRKHMEASGAFDETGFGVRTKLLPGAVAAILGSDHDPVLAATVASLVLEAAGLRLESETGKLATLLFVPAPRIRQIAGVVHEAWKGLTEGSKAAKETELAAVGKRIAALLADATRTPDIAMFGRMVADTDWGIEAGCQVAHAISTHAAATEFDFFTAMDDLQPAGQAGGAHMDRTQFTSATHYRFDTIDLGIVRANLRRDELVVPTILATLRGFVEAMPTGKQASFAAHNPPSYVLFVVHGGQPYSLANAFARPARPGEDADLVASSIRALEGYYARVLSMHGTRPGETARAVADRDATRDPGAIVILPSVADALGAVKAQIEAFLGAEPRPAGAAAAAAEGRGPRGGAGGGSRGHRS